MIYIIVLIILLISFKYYVVDGDLSKKKINQILVKNQLLYLKHKEVKVSNRLKEKFYESVNPFMFLRYEIKYYEVDCENQQGEKVSVYIKWWKRRGLFNRNKVYVDIEYSTNHS